MSILLAAKDKNEIIDLINTIAERLLYPRMAEKDIRAIGFHLRQMREHPGQMDTQCRFETVPELGLTRVVIEATFGGKGQ